MSEAARKAPGPGDAFDPILFAREVLQEEARAVLKLSQSLCGESFTSAVQLLMECRGRVIVSGMGKAGLIGNKLAATLASTGTCSHFVHPAEAFHGDLGRFHDSDCVVILSRSGQTEEITKILPSLQQRAIPIIALTARPASPLGRAARVILDIGDAPEVCNMGLAPSTSTTLMLALGDALALTVSRFKGFRSEDFARYHPGGSLGRKLAPVEQLMRPLVDCRIADWKATVRQVVADPQAGRRRTGAVMLVDDQGTLRGIFTDSDLARLVADTSADLDQPVANVMTVSPKTIRSGQTIAEAIETLDEYRISELPVVTADGRVVGLIDITDLLGDLDRNDSETEPPILRVTPSQQ